MAVARPSVISPGVVYRLSPFFPPRRCFLGIASFRWNLSYLNRKWSSMPAIKNVGFTSPETAKSFDFASEERIYDWWESQGYFKPTIDRGGDPFVVPMPPPNVTGSLHMGHAMFVTLEDIMIRYFRMKGRPALWLPGTDHAGIATQLVVERMLASEGLKRTDMSREEFTNKVWEWKEKYGGTITKQIRRLGASCDWTREHFTLDEQLSRAVIEAFVRLHEKGLIYQGSYMVNWSPSLQTAVSDLEVEYSEEPGTLFYLKYRVAGGSRSEYLTIATTRPETLFGDTAVAVNPEDERYMKYIGRQAIVPLTFGRHVPIIADKWQDQTRNDDSLTWTTFKALLLAKFIPEAERERLLMECVHFRHEDMSIGEFEQKFTRLVQFAPYLIDMPAKHKNWFIRGLRDDLQDLLHTTNASTFEGAMQIAVHVEAAEKKRMTRTIQPKTNEAIISRPDKGKKISVAAVQEKSKHVDREFGTGVLKISPGHDHNDYQLARKLGLPILNVMNKDGTLNDVAGLYSGLDLFEARKKLWSVLEETGLAVKKEPHTLRVPRSQRGGEVIEPLVSKQWFVTMEPLAEKALHAVEMGELTILPERFDKIYKHWLANIKDWCISRQLWWGHRIPVWYIKDKDCEEEYIVARNDEEALEKAYEKYGKSVEIYQDPDVLDTWFSSSLWPFSTLGWPDETCVDFKTFYPATMLETGHDILFFWVARMVMMGIEFTGTVPFSYVYLHGLIRDSQGRKMSKTLGNVIDPIDTITEYGTDALRFTISLGTAGQDLNLSTERLVSNKAFTNKLWNAGKFILQNLPRRSDSEAWDALLAYKFDSEEALNRLPLPESWVVSELHNLIGSVTASYEKFYFGDAGRGIYDFFWGDFADWYIESSKTRLYQSQSQTDAFIAHAVLLYVYENILKLLHPFMPFVTEELWQALPFRKQALMISPWPHSSLPNDCKSVKRFQNLQSLIRAIRNARAEYSVEPAKRISASIVGNAEVLNYISSEKQVLALLSRLDIENVHFMECPPDYANHSVHLVAGDNLEVYLPLSDMVDVSAETERLTKRLTKMQSEYDAILARLSSPSFVEKAPEEIVRGVREKAAEVVEKITLTKNRLALLESSLPLPR